MMKRKYSLEEKRRYCLALKESGIPSTQFSKTIGIAASTLRRWRIECMKEGLNEGFSPLILAEGQYLNKVEKAQVRIKLASQMEVNIEISEKNLVSFIQELNHASSIIR